VQTTLCTTHKALQLPVLNCSRTLTLPSLSAATLMFHHRHSRTAAQSLPSLIRFSPSA
jgi:hypothetical protein